MKKKFPQIAQGVSRRPALARMLQIHQAIQTGNYPTAAQLADQLEVSTKSVHRDIDFMSERLGLPVKYCKRHKGYCYTQEVGSFPTIQITQGELFALLVAEKALQQYRGTAFEKPLLSALKKLEASLPDTISLNMAEWEQSISFRTREQILDLEIFQQLASATSLRRQLRMTYRKPGQKVAEERLIDPYHLVNINGEWYLFAHDHARQDIRRFAPVRIKKLVETGKTFVRPANFSIDKHLRDSFGVYSPDGEYNVVVRFNAVVADYIREKKWHESQEILELPDGSVELRLKLSSLVEIQRWILGWGENATVLEPPKMVEWIKTTVTNTRKNYA